MAMRSPAGFIRPGFDPLKNPNAPTGVAATDTQSGGTVSVAFTPPANVGGSAISAYYAVSSPERITVSGATSPISVTGLTNGTPYTFQVWALNTYGPGPFSAASGSVTPSVLPQAVFSGDAWFSTNVIDYINFSALYFCADFGDLSSGRAYIGGCASSTRGLWAGGVGSNTIDFVTIATKSNSSDFGDLTLDRRDLSGLSNSTRGVFVGGFGGGNYTNIMDYVTIASAGNAIDFGDTQAGMYSSLTSSCASPTRGVIFAGQQTNTNPINVIQYITISSTGNTADFGDLGAAVTAPAACSNSTRGLSSGGAGAANADALTRQINFITIASLGNSSYFGDLSNFSTWSMSAVASSTRAITAGGGSSGASFPTSQMDYVEIATTGNAAYFAGLTVARYGGAGCSSVHGGL